MKAASDYKIQSGEYAIIELKGKLPKFCRNIDVLANPVGKITHACPDNIMVKLRKGRTRIQIKNIWKKTLIIPTNTPIIELDMSNINYVFEHISSISVDDNDTVFFIDHTESHNCLLTINKQDSLYDENKEKYPHLEHDDERLKMTDKQIIEKFIDLSKSDLTEEQKDKLRNTLLENKEAFSLRDEIGNNNDIEVDFDLTDTSPFFIRPFRVTENDNDR